MSGRRAGASGRWLRRAGGYASTELVAGIGLLLVPVALIVLSLPTWAETQSAARAVAREAARAYVLADDADAGVTAAVATAERTAANRDVRLVGSVRIGGHRDPRPGVPGEVEATVVVRLPVLVIPWVGPVGHLDWSVTHTEPIDVHRSRP